MTFFYIAFYVVVWFCVAMIIATLSLSTSDNEDNEDRGLASFLGIILGGVWPLSLPIILASMFMWWCLRKVRGPVKTKIK